MLINITPKMTSFTTPSPYKVSVYNQYNSAYDAWYAFDGDTSTMACLKPYGYIDIDLSKETKISGIRFINDGLSYNSFCNNLYVYGSNDGIYYNEILNITLLSNTSIGEYDLGGIFSYRYYRFKPTNSYTTTRFVSIELMVDSNVYNSITNHKILESELPESVDDMNTHIYMTDTGKCFISDLSGTLRRFGLTQDELELLNKFNSTYSKSDIDELLEAKADTLTVSSLSEKVNNLISSSIEW